MGRELAKNPRRSRLFQAAIAIALIATAAWNLARWGTGADGLQAPPAQPLQRLPLVQSRSLTGIQPTGWLVRLPVCENLPRDSNLPRMPLVQTRRLPPVVANRPLSGIAASDTSPQAFAGIVRLPAVVERIPATLVGQLPADRVSGVGNSLPDDSQSLAGPGQETPPLVIPALDGPAFDGPNVNRPAVGSSPGNDVEWNSPATAPPPLDVPYVPKPSRDSMPLAGPQLEERRGGSISANPVSLNPANGSELLERVPLAPPAPAAEDLPPASADTEPIPEGDGGQLARVPWWQEQVSQPLGVGPSALRIDLDTLILQALASSPRVKAISDQPLIRETGVLEAAAEFDPKSFLESKYVSLSDPVGNLLTTGGPPRFRQQDYQLSAGIRKKTTLGSTVEFSQKIGKLHNNSLFFAPPQQGNARLSLSFTQPLLRGAGKAYNTSLIVIAELDTTVAADQASAQIQDHLLEVARAYATLRLQRSVLLQKRRLSERAEEVLKELEAREQLDAMPSQIARARAAVATRRAILVRADTDVMNAETRIQTLVQDPALAASANLELIPQMTFDTQPIDVTLADAYVTALNHRPEIDESLKRAHAAEKRVGMAANEVLPTLDLVLETYLAGLAANYQTGNAFGDQFTEGQPGFTAGFVFESPWGNRADRARLQRRQLEYRQAANQFQETLATLKGEVEIAVREVETARREIEGNWQAMLAADVDIRLMEERWRHLPGDDGTRSFLLEDLLRAHERLAATEYDFSRAQFRYAVSLAELKRVTGVLVRREDLKFPLRGPAVGPVAQHEPLAPSSVTDATEPPVDPRRTPQLPSANATPAALPSAE